MERAHLDVESEAKVREEIQMFEGMHREAAERLDVGVAMVQRVDELVKRSVMEEPVDEVEVQLLVQRDEQCERNEPIAPQPIAPHL